MWLLELLESCFFPLAQLHKGETLCLLFCVHTFHYFIILSWASSTFFPFKLTLFPQKNCVASAVANGSAFLGRTVDASKVIIHKELPVWTSLKYRYLKKQRQLYCSGAQKQMRSWHSVVVSCVAPGDRCSLWGLPLKQAAVPTSVCTVRAAIPQKSLLIFWKSLCHQHSRRCRSQRRWTVISLHRISMKSPNCPWGSSRVPRDNATFSSLELSGNCSDRIFCFGRN